MYGACEDTFGIRKILKIITIDFNTFLTFLALYELELDDSSSDDQEKSGKKRVERTFLSKFFLFLENITYFCRL